MGEGQSRPRRSFPSHPTVVLLCLIAAGLHVLVTPVLLGTPVRLALSDPVVAVLAVPLLLHALHRPGLVRALWPWAGWLAVLGLWLVFAWWNGHRHFGTEPWALIKLAGWLLITIYFLSGLWAAPALGRGAVMQVLRFFFLTSWAVAFAALNFQTMAVFGLYWDTPGTLNRLQGFSANPNAFGFLLTCTIALQPGFQKQERLFSPVLHWAGLGLCILAIVLTGSRSAYLGLIAALAVLAFFRVLTLGDIGRLALAVLAWALAWLTWREILGVFAESSGSPQATAALLADPLLHNEQIVSVTGIRHRVEITLQALSLWWSAPLEGAGLGAFLALQRDMIPGISWTYTDQGGDAALVSIHTTILWILTETGLIGAVLFGAFFVFVVARLYARVRDGSSPAFRPAAVGGLALMAAFAATSLGTEVLYQRHVWFLAGLVLGLCALAPQGNNRNSSS